MLARLETRVGHPARAVWVCLTLSMLMGCEAPGSAAVNPELLEYEVVVPAAPGPLSPSFVRLAPGESYRPGVHAEVEACGECHPVHAEQWRGSAHALSSFNNPFYRFAFEEYTAAVGQQRGAFCGGCHDPLMMFDGAIGREIVPDDPRAHGGITCNVCHGMTMATIDGVASYESTTRPIPIPIEGDAASLAAHRARVGMATLRTEALCVSCHRGFLSKESGHPTFLPALDEYGPWRASAHAGMTAGIFSDPVSVATCVDCHMPEVDASKGVHHSHRFPGGHSTLAAAIGNSDQGKAIRDRLRNIVDIDIPVLGIKGRRGRFIEDSVGVTPGTELWFDVVITNRQVGHMFPGGARDLRDTWVELVLQDARGQTLAESGVAYARDGVEPDVHRLHAGMVDEQGHIVKTHGVSHFRTPAYDNTIAPQDSRVVRYAWSVPVGFSDGAEVTIKARLRHRRLSVPFHEAVCESSRAGRGLAFVESTRRRMGLTVDPCIEQPVIDLANVTARVGAGSSQSLGGERWPKWKRLYRHGLAMRQVVQEKLGEAIESLQAALDEFGAHSGGRDEAMVRLALAEALVRQGRVDEGLTQIDAARTVWGEHPAMGRVHGEGLSRLWLSEQAVAPFAQAVRGAPKDPRRWRSLAITLGSAGRHGEALEAARAGLLFEPRDSGLLRAQYLALKNLGAAAPVVERAKTAFLEHRDDEAAALVKARCSEASAACRLERLPVHVHSLKARPR